MAAVMMNVRSMVKLIQAFETLDMADSASQQRVLDIWIGQNSMEVVSQTPSGAELMELYVMMAWSCPTGWPSKMLVQEANSCPPGVSFRREYAFGCLLRVENF